MPAPTTPAAPTAPATTASTRIRSTRPNRRPHPNLAALKERAFTLACTGLRSPAIATQLHIPERTIRRWVNDTLLSLAQDTLDPEGDSDTSGASSTSDSSNTPSSSDDANSSAHGSSPAAGDTTSPDAATGAATRPTPIPLERHRALAIESQRAVAATAHAAYDRLMARHDALLDSLTTVLRDNLLPATDGAAATSASLSSLPPAAALLTRLIAHLEAGATRHLRIAQAAHREAARFQGVPAYTQTDARLTATEAHAGDTADSDDESEGGLVPIKWIDPNDPNEVGLIPRSTFDANAAIDELCNAPTSSLDKLKQADGAKNHATAPEDEDEDEEEQDEDAILAAILAEQTAGDSQSAPTEPATGAATTPATGAATSPATALDERPTSYSTDDTDAAFARDPWGVYEERQRERRLTLMEGQSTHRPPPTLPHANTMGALFLRNPHYVF